MRKKYIISIAIFLVLIISGFIIYKGSKKETVLLKAEVKRGLFEILVYTSGQLEAENSVNIVVPESLRDRNIRIHEIKITDLIEEGTVVDSGDYVASLDQKVVEEVILNAQTDLEQALASLEDAKMDSNLTLSNYRDIITNSVEGVEEMRIILKETIFESPSVVRKAEMDLDKAIRKLEQDRKSYELKTRQVESRVDRYIYEVKQRQTRLDKLQEVLQSLKIYAPESGMLIYGRDNTREKIKVGSTVSAWMPIIATLPDMSAMMSLTFVNEIDISRIKTGQKVSIGIDAVPDKKLEGEVILVANIGQPMPKSDAKVFEVKIKVFGDVEGLKPAMTTSNIIRTGVFADTLFIPSETIFKNDSMQFVVVEQKNGFVKKVVDLGDENENYTIVRKGLQTGEILLFNLPENHEKLAIEGIEILKEIQKRKDREEAETVEDFERGKETD